MFFLYITGESLVLRQLSDQRLVRCISSNVIREVLFVVKVASKERNAKGKKLSIGEDLIVNSLSGAC